jgi:hypothetical protein
MIVDVWRGSILTLDGALQLLLLVDYVFDWARDIYREDIIRSLRILASGDNDTASTLYSDTDIFSTRLVDQPELHSSTAGNEDYQAYMSARSPFVANDSDLSVVRHASFVESRYCCVFATRDNVRTMLQSTRQTRTQKVCRMILERMADAMLLDQSGVEAMEERWTGTARTTPPALASKTQFYTIISCTNYLSAGWHQVRELYVVAVADDAWDDVVEGSKLKPNRDKARRPLAEGVDVSTLLKNIDGLQAGTPGDTLLACITRRAVELHVSIDFGFYESVKTPAETSAGPHTPMRTILYPVASDGIFRDIVHYMYTSLKKGSLEPQESFMRVSNRFDQQHLLRLDEQPLYPRRTRRETLQLSKDGCVLIRGQCHPHDPEKSPSETCLYLVNGDPTLPTTKQEVAELAKRTFETRDIYHTTQDNGTSNLATLSRKASGRTPWNLQDTYGISSATYGLRYFVLERCAASDGPPSRQGSPRVADGAESGAYLLKRTLIPWSDRRRLGGEEKVRMFFIYKLMSREIRYWKQVAAVRNAEGTWACAWCARVGDEADGESGDICDECWEASTGDTIVEGEDEVMFDWLRNCFMGEPPFPAIEGATEDEDTLFEQDMLFEHPLPPLDVRWNQALSAYPALENPFEDMAELLAQRGFQDVVSEERQRPEEEVF